MIKETPESVRAIVSLFALFTIALAALQFGVGASLDIAGGLLILIPGLVYAYIAICWYSLLKERPKIIRLFLKANLLLLAIFAVYRILRGGDSSIIIGFAIAFFGSSFVQQGVDVYSSETIVKPNEKKG